MLTMIRSLKNKTIKQKPKQTNKQKTTTTKKQNKTKTKKKGNSIKNNNKTVLQSSPMEKQNKNKQTNKLRSLQRFRQQENSNKANHCRWEGVGFIFWLISLSWIHSKNDYFPGIVPKFVFWYQRIHAVKCFVTWQRTAVFSFQTCLWKTHFLFISFVIKPYILLVYIVGCIT